MGREDLGVWQRQKGIWVLQATQMPAILIETGFIANAEDERYLNSEQGQQEIAEAIAKGIKKYKDLVENPQPASIEPTLSTTTE
jgi:N-acetylmuramoyl-L-alanine amidase